MFWFIVLVIVLAVAAYKFRVPLLAKVLGQPQSRIERRLNRPQGLTRLGAVRRAGSTHSPLAANFSSVAAYGARSMPCAASQRVVVVGVGVPLATVAEQGDDRPGLAEARIAATRRRAPHSRGAGRAADR